jgi:hypothetical protein
VLGSRWLVVEAARLKDGLTGIRVDGEVVWIRVRAASEKVPPGVGAIDVVRAIHGQPPSVFKSVTSHLEVKKVIGWIDRLPITQPELNVDGCPTPPADAPTVTFAFRASRHGRMLAQASVPADVGNTTSPCDGMPFLINGHPKHQLGRPKSFLKAVQRLLGVKLTSNLPRQGY